MKRDNLIKIKNSLTSKNTGNNELETPCRMKQQEIFNIQCSVKANM